MMIGLHIIPNFNAKSIPAIKSSIPTNSKIITNYKIGLPHQFLKFTEENNKIFGSTDVHVSRRDIDMNIDDPHIRQIAMMGELAKRSEKMILVFPDKKAVSPLLIVMAKSVRPTRVIIEDTILTPEQVTSLINATDPEMLKQQYENIVTPKTKALYTDDELIRTPNGAKLRQYQQQMVEFVLERERVGLFVDMGLGKTLATLASIDQLVQKGRLNPEKPILIIAPITVALDTWVREADKWGYNMDVKVNIGLTPKKRAVLLDSLLEPQEKVTLVTTNPAQLKAMYAHFDTRGKQPPFQMVIVDELSMFKNPTAQRTDLLIDKSKNVEFFIGLTGTPAPNNLLDIWSQLIVIDSTNTKLFGRNQFVYRDEFFVPAWVAPDGRVYSYKLKSAAEEEIYRRMRRSVISMRSVGLVDLPDITYSNHYVTLPPKAQKMYDELVSNFDQEDGLTVNLESVSTSVGLHASDDDEIQISQSATLTGKLLQLASGAIYKDLYAEDMKSKEYTTFHDEKFKALKDIVEAATSPILVFYQFKSDLDRMGDYIEFEHLKAKSKDFTDMIRRWNAGEIPVMAVYPGTAGHGLNLQDGGHTIVWLTPTWSNETYRQANKRLHRSGQKNPVSIIHIVAKNTKDEDVIEALDVKEDGQDRLMEALDVAHRE